MDPVIAAAFLQERARAEYEMGQLLDRLCRRWDMDPVMTWRLPRQARIDMSAFPVRYIAGFDIPVLEAASLVKGSGA